MSRLQNAGIRCGVLDITTIGNQVTPEQWYASIIATLTSSFQLQFDLRSWWRDRSHLSLIHRLNEFLETVLLAEINQNVVIFIDEIDSVLGLAFPIDDFFALIRACYNKRAERPIYSRLTFALLGVATPADLISDQSRTPFNIGRAVQLRGFQFSEAMPLLPGLAQVVSDPEAVLHKILAWTGGQPFLTQKLCQLLVEKKWEKEVKAWMSRRVDDSPSPQLLINRLVYTHIINNWETQDEPEHLRTIRDRLLHDKQQASRLLGIYQQVLEKDEDLRLKGKHDLILGALSSGAPTEDSPDQMTLLLSGLVEKHERGLQVKNPIYRAVFDLDWVVKQLDQLRPYSESLDAWVASKFQDNSRLLLGQALQEVLGWAQGKSLSDLDYKFLAASQEVDRRDTEAKLEVRRLKEVETRLAVEQRNARRQRQLLTVMSVIMAIAVALGLTAYWQYRQAAFSEVKAIATSSEALLASNHRLDGLVASLKAKRYLQQLGGSDATLQNQVDKSLWQAVYGVIESNRLTGDGAPMRSVAFSPDGQTLATANGYFVQLWHRDGTLLKTFNGHTADVYSVSFSPDGKAIASASRDNTTKLWDLNGRLLKTLAGHTITVLGVGFSPNGQLIATASADKTVKLWSRDGTLLKTLQGHGALVKAVKFSPDGQLLASASSDKTVKLWSSDGTLRSTLEGHRAGVEGVSFSPNGQLIATASADKTVKLWSRDGSLLKTFEGHRGGVLSVAISPNGQTIASVSEDKTIKRWSLEGTELATLKGHRGGVYGIAFSPNGQTIASASWDGTVRLWKPNDALLKTLSNHSGTIRAVAFSPNGQMLASGSEDTTVKLWKPDGTLLRTLQGHGSRIRAVAFSPNGQMLASGSEDTTVKLWKPDGTLLRTIAGQQNTVATVAFSPDNKTLATAGGGKTIRIWSLDGSALTTLKSNRSGITGIRFSPNGQFIASGDLNKTIKLWSLNGRLLKTFQGRSPDLSNLVFSSDGQMIISAGEHNTVKLWRTDGTLLRTFQGHSSVVLGVDLSPDGQIIASAGIDQTIKLWRTDGTLLRTLEGHDGVVWSVSFSPDGKTLASASEDQTVILWNLERILKLAPLTYGCHWVKDYLRTNVEVENRDRHLCDGF